MARSAWGARCGQCMAARGGRRRRIPPARHQFTAAAPDVSVHVGRARRASSVRRRMRAMRASAGEGARSAREE
eukprot:CAMPEP_0176247760 /NCGR_PEP_ID=MMETSP0121_2-20121125/33118_1 /TAXON_ID=160619 /ORGANISM="Kryptoperidinium foliaceum, Strain CCMP 1326" /LENGTH=72 /DNA_ID=CAMNT_0017587419 /DNA_START=58 /DNA_END=273 /DNA_ORIENTATION=-